MKKIDCHAIGLKNISDATEVQMCSKIRTPIRLTRSSPSPLKRTPKRQRIYSQIIVQCDSEYRDIITKNSSSQTDDVQEM